MAESNQYRETPDHNPDHPSDWRSFVVEEFHREESSGAASASVRSETSSNFNVIPHPAWLNEDTVTIEELVSVAKLTDLTKIARRLEALFAASLDEQDQGCPMSLASAKDLLSFSVSDPKLREPKIGLTNDGNVQSEWHLLDGRHIAVKFLTKAKIRLVAIVPPASPDDLPDTIQKTFTINDAVDFIRKENLLS